MSVSPTGPPPAVDAGQSQESPTTGDETVDAILSEFAQAGTQGAQAQVDAAASAHRKLQARLSAP